MTHDITRALSILFRRGQVVECRVPNTGKTGTVSGYFDDWQALTKAAQSWDKQAQGVYVTLNEVDPVLLARCANVVKTYTKITTTDADIVRRRWILVDFDSDKKSGISASDSEHEDALTRAKFCADWLRDRFGIESVYADSGNGGHVLLPIDLPNDEAATELVKGVLEGLDCQYTDDAVKVDLSVFNAGRISKLYGTTACKGSDTPDRPHRLSRLLHVPETLTPVPVEVLDQIAALCPKPEPVQPERDARKQNRHEPFDLMAFAANNGLRIAASVPRSGRTCHRLEVCPFNPEHRTPDAAIFEYPDGRLGFKCLHNSCAGKGWRDVRELFEPGYRQKRGEWKERQDAPTGRQQTNSKPAAPAATVQPTVLPLETVAWPCPLDTAALHGIAGEILNTIAPQTEADPAAILAQLLVGYGSMIGRSAYFYIAGVRHYANLFAVIVGQTALGGKGTSWAEASDILTRADVDFSWSKNRVKSGLSSGEGVVWAVRDPIEKKVAIKEGGKNGTITGYQTEITDQGEEDKRLLVVEGEFASVLGVMGRESNTLSAVLRNAWDTGKLNIMTKNNPAKATDAHISLIAHVTREELRRKLTETEQGNGFANRFLWIAARRSKCLPFGGRIPEDTKTGLAEKLREAAAFGREAGAMEMDSAASDAWRSVYPELTAEKPGLLGSIVTRAAPITLRLACLYALAVWQYAEDSAAYIFGDALGDPVADEVLRALRNAGTNGLARSVILREVFQSHVKADRVGLALALLQSRGLARMERRDSDGGRTAEFWFAGAEEGGEQE